MTACTIVALVLSFAMLREHRLGATLWWLRLHLLATAAALLAGAAAGAPAAWLAAGAAILAVSAWRIGGVLGALDQRTGPGGVAGRWTMPLIAIGLGLTALAVLAVTGSAGPASGREAEALALATALLGLLSVARGGAPALWLARFASLADGLVLLGGGEPGLPTVAAALIAPAVTAVALATIGRTGGLPLDGADGAA